MIISVIIAVYNEQNYIAKCLNSLQLQVVDHPDEIEIIVIDDGSTDRTLEIIKNFKNIKLLHQNHQGPATARNVGAKYARGEILVFVDADMEFDRNFLNNLCYPIKTQVSKGTYSLQEYVANWANPIARCWNWNNKFPPKMRILPQAEGTDFRAILTSEFQKVSGFDKGGYTDTWSLYKKLGYRPTLAQNAIYYHYNPDTFSETFSNAQWVGKREYKLGFAGILIATLRSSFPVSIINGIIGIFKFKEPVFLLYKIVWDFGILLGILRYSITKQGSK